MIASCSEEVIAIKQSKMFKDHITWLKEHPDALHKEAVYCLTKLGLMEQGPDYDENYRIER